MKITHKNSPKAGITEHLPPLVAQTLIAAGLADAVKYKSYVERLNDEQAAMTKTPPVVSWGTLQVTPTASTPYGVVVTKEVLGEKTIYDSPPKDCPPVIAARFRKEASVYAQARQDRENARKTDADRRTH